MALKKLLLLLDEVTIINFRFLFKISLRYKILLSILGISFLTLLSYQYLNQPIIHTSVVHFNSSTKHSVSSDLSSLLPITNEHSTSAEELNAISHSYNFLLSFAEKIIEHPQFNKINFGSTNNGKELRGRTIEEKCENNKICIKDRISSSIGEIFNIEEGKVPNSFVLNIHSLDSFSAKTLAVILSQQIDNSRVVTRKKIVEKELESVNKLVEEIKTSFTKANGFNLIENNEKVQNSISEYKDRIRNMQDEINREKAILASFEVKVTQNRKVVKAGNTQVDQLSKEQLVKISQKINDIRYNLANLTSIPEDQRTISDKTIIEQLKKELTSLEQKVPQQNDLKNIAINDEFVENQRKREHDFEFDRIVLNKKVERLEHDLRMAKLDLESLLQSKIEGESKLNTLKADMEFLKNLEAKQTSLKLIHSTISSDLHFEEIDPRTTTYRRSSFVKIFFFSAFLSLFIYFIVLIIYFIIDDKIYNTDDLSLIIDKSMIIGDVPHFDLKNRITDNNNG